MPRRKKGEPLPNQLTTAKVMEVVKQFGKDEKWFMEQYDNIMFNKPKKTK